LTVAFRGLGFRDPRWLSLTALAAVLFFVLRSVPFDRRPIALGVLVLALPVVFGVLFGSPVTFLTLLLCLGWAESQRRKDISTGGLLGAALAVGGTGWAAVPFLGWPTHGADRRSTRRGLIALALTAAVLCLPAVLPDARAFLSALSRPDEMTPGLGLVNFVLYLGSENDTVPRMFFAATPLIVAAFITLLFWRLPRIDPEGKAALAVLVLLFLLPSVPPEAVALPILLASLPLLRPEVRVPPSA
jgi:hypothetical protein